MNFAGRVLKLAGVASLSWVTALGGLASPAAPRAAFQVSPVNPAARSGVDFEDLSSGSPAGWLWDFGDGTRSTDRNPRHVYEAAGTYPVSLTVSNGSGATVSTFSVTVTEAATLRLLAGHPFDVTLTARDPRTSNTGVGEAIPQNDVFGYFTVPALVPTSGVVVPEVFVKMLDATPIGQNYWVFYGGLTDLEYTLTFREVATGRVKVFHNPVTDSRVCLGADTSGFFEASTPTPTPPGGSPTPTPTPSSGALRIDVDVARFRYLPGTASPIQVTAGVLTELIFEASDVTHGFSGIPELGIPGSTNISPGGDDDPYGGGMAPRLHRVTFTAPASTRGMTFAFRCTANPECGTGHDGMIGTLHVN